MKKLIVNLKNKTKNVNIMLDAIRNFNKNTVIYNNYSNISYLSFKSFARNINYNKSKKIIDREEKSNNSLLNKDNINVSNKKEIKNNMIKDINNILLQQNNNNNTDYTDLNTNDIISKQNKVEQYATELYHLSKSFFILKPSFTIEFLNNKETLLNHTFDDVKNKINYIKTNFNQLNSKELLEHVLIALKNFKLLINNIDFIILVINKIINIGYYDISCFVIILNILSILNNNNKSIHNDTSVINSELTSLTHQILNKLELKLNTFINKKTNENKLFNIPIKELLPIYSFISQFNNIYDPKESTILLFAEVFCNDIILKKLLNQELVVLFVSSMNMINMQLQFIQPIIDEIIHRLISENDIIEENTNDSDKNDNNIKDNTNNNVIKIKNFDTKSLLLLIDTLSDKNLILEDMMKAIVKRLNKLINKDKVVTINKETKEAVYNYDKITLNLSCSNTCILISNLINLKSMNLTLYNILVYYFVSQYKVETKKIKAEYDTNKDNTIDTYNKNENLLNELNSLLIKFYFINYSYLNNYYLEKYKYKYATKAMYRLYKKQIEDLYGIFLPTIHDLYYTEYNKIFNNQSQEKNSNNTHFLINFTNLEKIILCVKNIDLSKRANIDVCIELVRLGINMSANSIRCGLNSSNSNNIDNSIIEKEKELLNKFILTALKIFNKKKYKDMIKEYIESNSDIINMDDYKLLFNLKN